MTVGSVKNRDSAVIDWRLGTAVDAPAGSCFTMRYTDYPSINTALFVSSGQFNGGTGVLSNNPLSSGSTIASLTGTADGSWFHPSGNGVTRLTENWVFSTASCG